jgi:hypothetical protein
VRRLATSIDITASPAAVWRALTNFAAYPEWNPFIRRLVGEPRVGARLEVTVQPAGRRAMTFKPTVLAADPERELRWFGRVIMPGLFDGEHAFIIERTSAGCRLHQEENFHGLLVPLFGAMLDDTEKSFEALNRALKQRVERR